MEKENGILVRGSVTVPYHIFAIIRHADHEVSDGIRTYNEDGTETEPTAVQRGGEFRISLDNSAARQVHAGLCAL
jgi:hypothetical protein